MSAGKGKRWNDYLGISKQEAKINDENLLERTVRLIKKYDINSNIIISSSNHNHYVKGAKMHCPIYKDYYKSKYTLELIDDEIVYLYGDTFYDDEIIREIINFEINDVMFYGDSKSIVGLKVKDYIQLSSIINSYDGTGSLYHYFKRKSEMDNVERFCYVGNEYYNINTPENYEKLLYVYNQLSLENKLLCVGIIWNVSLQWKNEIFDEISNKYNIISSRTINLEFNAAKSFPEEVLICVFKLDNPHFELHPQKKQITCREVILLKKSISDRYRTITNGKIAAVVDITSTPIEFIKSMEYISELEEKKLKHLIRR